MFAFFSRREAITVPCSSLGCQLTEAAVGVCSGFFDMAFVYERCVHFCLLVQVVCQRLTAQHRRDLEKLVESILLGKS